MIARRYQPAALLAWGTGTTSPHKTPNEVEFAVSDKAIPFPKIAFVSGQGLVLTFTLPDPEKRALVELALHLKWPKAAPARMKLTATAAEAMAGSESGIDPDSCVGALLAQVGEEPTAAHQRLRSMAATTAKNEPVTTRSASQDREVPRPEKSDCEAWGHGCREQRYG